MIRRSHTVAILAIALIAFAGSAFAQTSWSFEVVGGLEFTQLTGDDTDATTVFADPDIEGDIGGMKLGFTLGGLVTVAVNDNFAVQSGLMWARKGSDGDITVRNVDVPGVGLIDATAEVTITLDYVEIPILGVFSFPVGEVVTLRTMAGPVLAFNSNAELEVSVAGASESIDVGDDVKSVDIGGLIGAGIVVPVGALNFHADARYTIGFTKVDDSDANLDWKNSGFAVTVALGIPLTR